MSELQQLNKKTFAQLKAKRNSSDGRLDYSQVDLLADSDWLFDREVEQAYGRMRELIFLSLLKHQLTLSDIPQESRVNCLEINGYFSVAAHRCARESNNVTYLTEVLSMMYEDAIYGVSNDIITFREFDALICQWLNYFNYDKIEFKGDEDFERYFQEQKENHRELFEAFDL